MFSTAWGACKRCRIYTLQCRNCDCALIALVHVVDSHMRVKCLTLGIGSSVKVGEGGGGNLIWTFKPEKGGCGKKLRATVPETT